MRVIWDIISNHSLALRARTWEMVLKKVTTQALRQFDVSLSVATICKALSRKAVSVLKRRRRKRRLNTYGQWSLSSIENDRDALSKFRQWIDWTSVRGRQLSQTVNLHITRFWFRVFFVKAHMPDVIVRTLSRFVFAACCLTSAISFADERPNIVLIMADDMGYECLSCNGSLDYKTPNLDRLAASGLRLSHCYSQPICTPSRVKLMTGQSNKRNYVRFGRLSRNQVTFAQLLKDAGYKTCIAGKWQLGKEKDSPQHFGFEQSLLWQHTRGRTDERGHDTRYPNPKLEKNGERLDFDGGEFSSDVFVDFISGFMEQNSDQPFLVYYPMALVHCPFCKVPDSAGWNSKSLGDNSYKGNPKCFADMVAYCDKSIGRIDSKLKELGIRENTLLIFVGDNGTDTPIVTNTIHGKVAGAKGKMIDAGNHVPGVVSWPCKMKSGRVLDDLVDFSDILPTICEAADVTIPRTLTVDGQSFLPQVKGEVGNPRDSIYVWYSRDGGSARARAFARNRRYKLYESGKFFDVPADPLEKNPLTELTGQQKKVRELLEARIKEFANVSVIEPAKNSSSAVSADDNLSKPNFVIIYTDDQGYGDLGCFGSTTIRTPNIDKLALEGRKFTNFLVAASVCTPSRAALLTGCYPRRINMHQHVIFPSDTRGLHPDEHTIADHLRGLGYATGCFGKWHLGHCKPVLPTSNGFDTYFGIPYSNDMNHPDNQGKPASGAKGMDILWRDPESTLTKWKTPLMRDAEIVEIPVDQRTITRRYVDEAIKFMTQQGDKPFFVYLPHSMPHIPLYVPEEVRDSDPQNAYINTIEHIDAETGRLLKEIDNLGLRDNTYVIYTTDNGPWLSFQHHAGSAGQLRGGKFDTFEGGHRVPCLMRGPGIPAGTVCGELSSTIDLLPTIAALTKSTNQLSERKIDGVDISPLLNGTPGSPRKEFLYYSPGGQIEGIRKGEFKLLIGKKKNQEPKVQLFKLTSDIAESKDISNQEPEVVRELREQMETLAAELRENDRPQWHQ